jgi:pimeloyl-ACP methyl ester carboxylesterase
MEQHVRMGVPRDLEPFARSITLPRSGASLFYYDAGSPASPSMLLVHGLGDEADTWRSVIAPLSRTFRVIAPDLPGFGRSAPPGRARLSPPFLSGILRELMTALQISGAICVGSSLGAVLVELAAREDPALASRLLLADGGLGIEGKIPPSLLLMLLPGLGENRYRRLKGDLDAAYASLRPYYADLDAMPETERVFLRQRVEDRVMSDTQRRAYFSTLRGYIGWLLLHGRSARPGAKRPAQDVLYVWGAEDHIVPLSAARAAHAGESTSKLTIIAGAGHLPHQEKPGEFVRIVRGFVGAATAQGEG